MDRADREFLAAERRNIEVTLEMLCEASSDPNPSDLERIGTATLLQNLYTGMERILRFLLQARAIKVPPSGSWHKDLLARAVEGGIITHVLADNLMQLLLFRHVHVHGYAFRIEASRIQPLIDSAPATVQRFFSETDKIITGDGLSN